jgi:hypothetical protein
MQNIGNEVENIQKTTIQNFLKIPITLLDMFTDVYIETV